MLALAVFTKAPIGAVRVLPARAHHVLDFALALGILVSPLAYWRHLSVEPVVAAVASALLIARVSTLTVYTSGWRVPARTGSTDAAANPIARDRAAAPVTPQPRGTPGAAGPAGAEPVKRTPSSRGPNTAWTLGVLVSRSRARHGPRPEGGSARVLGRAVGRTKPRGQPPPS